MELFQQQAWLQSQKKYDESIQQHWEDIRNVHFDKKLGAAYWIDKLEEAKIDPEKDWNTLQDFLDSPLSLCDEDILKKRPITDFIPKSVQNSSVKVLTSSGSVGRKKEVAWSDSALDYAASYADYCFDRMGISRGMDWIVQGPYGIFQEVVRRALARRGGLIHSAGIESRNIKKHFASIKSEEDFKSNQFVQVTLGPAMEFTFDTLAKEKIGGLATAIQILPLIAGSKGFENIQAVYLSGMEIPKEMYGFWRQKIPYMKFISSFGHHTLGFCYSTPFPDEPYYPPSPLSLIHIVREDDPHKLVSYGERGRHRILRMEPAFLWCQLDRDYSVRVAPREEFKWDGIKDVQPML